MGARMSTGIALTGGAPESLDVGQAPSRKTNSRKEPVPLSHRKAKARESIEVLDEGEESSEERVARMAQRKFEESAAIDAAVNLGFMNRGMAPLRGEAMQRKLRVSLTPELWDEMRVRIAEGESMYTVCADEHMPARTTTYKAISADSNMRVEYETAMEHQADKRAEQIVELSLQAKQRAAMGASTEEINAIKLVINSLQWVASRINPKKWGDKQSIDLDAKVALTEPQVDMRLAALIAKAKAKPVTE